MKWTKATPTNVGFYWCRRGTFGNIDVRMVKVWGWPEREGTDLFTNEDGGAMVEDTELYPADKTWWYGPIQPPKFDYSNS